MNKIFKRILIAVLIVVCSLSLFACADTEETEKQTGLFCKKIGGIYTIYKYVDDGTTSSLDIKKALEDMNITDTNVRIQKNAFNANDSLKEIIVPSSVTKIEKGAFAGMKAIETLSLPYIGMNDTGDAFVGETAPSEDKAVDAERTFAHLFGDTEYDGAIAQTINYGQGSTTDDAGETTNQSVNFYIPLSLNKVIVTGDKVPAGAFSGITKYIKIELADTVKAIGDYAFSSAIQLNAIKLPTSIEYIGKGAFMNASSLATVNLSELTNLTVINERAFSNTALESVITPSSLRAIGKSAFEGCASLTAITLNNGLTSISHYAFRDCASLKKIVIEQGTQNESIIVGNYAFSGCSKNLPTAVPNAFKLINENAYPKAN